MPLLLLAGLLLDSAELRVLFDVPPDAGISLLTAAALGNDADGSVGRLSKTEGDVVQPGAGIWLALLVVEPSARKNCRPVRLNRADAVGTVRVWRTF